MKEGVESLGRVRAQAMVLLVLAFLAGAFVGGTMERVMCTAVAVWSGRRARELSAQRRID